MKRIVLLLALLGIALTTFLSAQGGDPNYGKPKRVNKMIELLEAGQPVYNAVAQGGDGYEEGKALAQTGNDFIIYEMEHGAFEPLKLRDFMRGLVDGGPTKSGHRTPAVVVTLPVLGLDATSVRANHWVIEQVLAAGVHGMTLCHARDPEAVKMFVASTRFQFERADLKGADKGIPEGLRGAGGESFAARIWGVTSAQFVALSDPWPMNPKGELILSMKMEDKYALERVAEITRVPGIAWGEWGPGDQAMSLMGLPYLTRGGRGGGDPDAVGGGGGGRGRGGRGAAAGTPVPEGLPPIGEPKLDAARAHIMATMKANHIFPLHSSNINNIEQLIRAGVMVTHGTSVELMNKGRAYTKRQMPY